MHQYVRHTHADETPKAGLSWVKHKVIFLQQLENFLAKNVEQFTIVCFFPYITDAFKLKSIPFLLWEGRTVMNVYFQSEFFFIMSHMLLIVKKQREKQKLVYGNACCELETIEHSLDFQNRTLIIKTALFEPFLLIIGWCNQNAFCFHNRATFGCVIFSASCRFPRSWLQCDCPALVEVEHDRRWREDTGRRKPAEAAAGRPAEESPNQRWPASPHSAPEETTAAWLYSYTHTHTTNIRMTNKLWCFLI